jgi:glycosyltransferase involved in cell wall biosynthesis
MNFVIFLSLLLLSVYPATAFPFGKPTLYVILPYSNPIGYDRRAFLLKQTVQELTQHSKTLSKVRLTVVVSQLAYGKEPFVDLSASGVKDKWDFRFRTSERNVLWSKENLVNLAVMKVIEKKRSAKYFAFVDADITFKNGDWVQKTIQVLKEKKIFAQMFSTATMEESDGNRTTNGFGFQYFKSGNYVARHNKHPEYFHPGFAWAFHKSAFDCLGGLIDRTLGGADVSMALSLIGRSKESFPVGMDPSYVTQITHWEDKAKMCEVKLSYVDNHIYHHWHGSLENRKYVERWNILIQHQFRPYDHMKIDESGLLVWTLDAPLGLLNDVMSYFMQRNEDEPKFQMNQRKYHRNPPGYAYRQVQQNPAINPYIQLQSKPVPATKPIYPQYTPSKAPPKIVYVPTWSSPSDIDSHHSNVGSNHREPIDLNLPLIDPNPVLEPRTDVNPNPEPISYSEPNRYDPESQSQQTNSWDHRNDVDNWINNGYKGYH